ALTYLWILGLALVTALLLYQLGPILAPFLFAAILAYIFNPLVDWLQAHRVPRTLGVVMVVVLLALSLMTLVLLLIPFLETEISQFYRRLPLYLEWMRQQLAPWLQQKLGVKLDWEQLKQLAGTHLSGAGGVMAKLAASITSGGAALLAFFANVILVPVVFFYLLRDWNQVIANVDALVPRRWYAETGVIAREMDRVLAEFLRGQLSVMLVMSAFYVLALWMIGLNYALPIGLITGMLVFIPYVGAVAGFLLGSLAAVVQFSSPGEMVPVWLVFGVGQVLESALITPWLVGDRVGLHPAAVIFALLAFGQLFGFFGVLLAIPASAAILVALRHYRAKYLDSAAYRDPAG
ncbi:MAG: AI-2E family transporter, partial [Burkholderiales bacterium]